jgi:hypothetical protein
MAVTLTAPISAADLEAYPGLKLPDGFAGDSVTLLLNKAWAALSTFAHQPLSQTANTEIEQFGSGFCNVAPDGSLVVLTRNTQPPPITITSLSYSVSPANCGWTALTGFDTVNEKVILSASPFRRGDTGFVQLVYTSGFPLSSVPEDLKIACALMANHLLSGGFFPTEGGSGEGSLLPAWLPRDVDRILNTYTRKR